MNLNTFSHNWCNPKHSDEADQGIGCIGLQKKNSEV